MAAPPSGPTTDRWARLLSQDSGIFQGKSCSVGPEQRGSQKALGLPPTDRLQSIQILNFFRLLWSHVIGLICSLHHSKLSEGFCGKVDKTRADWPLVLIAQHKDLLRHTPQGLEQRPTCTHCDGTPESMLQELE